MPEMPVGFCRLHLKVRNRRFQLRVPVDEALVFVDEALVVQLDEDFADSVAEAFVHGEAFTRPVGRGTKARQLLHDFAAGFAFPFPNTVQEFLAAEVAAGYAFFGQLALDHHLRCNARMVHAGLPQRILAGHPVIADQHVLQRECQRVAHVQAAGDIRRRHHDHIWVGGAGWVWRRTRSPAPMPHSAALRRLPGRRSSLRALVLASWRVSAHAHRLRSVFILALNTLNFLAYEVFDHAGQVDVQPLLQHWFQKVCNQGFDGVAASPDTHSPRD